MRAERGAFLWIGGALVALVSLVAVLAPLLAPFEPQVPSGPSLEAPSSQHLLGTNDAGEDILSQIIFGARSSMVVAILAATLAVGIGAAAGASAGLARGWTDRLAMRLVDLFLAVPALPLLVLIAALAGPSRGTVILVVGLAGWPPVARIVRSQTLSIGGRGFIAAARGFGAGRVYVVRRHLLPALWPLLVATFVNWAATAIVLQAGLAFLGLSDPTEVSWGGILNRALAHPGVYFTSEWLWWVLPAGLAITAAAAGLAFLGLAFEPRSNPRWSRA